MVEVVEVVIKEGEKVREGKKGEVVGGGEANR